MLMLSAVSTSKTYATKNLSLLVFLEHKATNALFKASNNSSTTRTLPYGAMNNNSEVQIPHRAFGKISDKMKHSRVAFTDCYKSIPVNEFAKHTIRESKRRRELSTLLNVPEKHIKKWCRNRQMDQKKGNSNMHTAQRITSNVIVNSNVFTSTMPVFGFPSQSTVSVT
ncbi:hypothetical protein ACJJTC_007904 [Scirpophaga incertulas]